MLREHPQFRRGHAENVPKHAGEMKWVAEADFLGGLFDENTGLLQLFSGVIHLEPQQILIRALVIIASEQAAQVGFVQVTFLGDLFQGS